VANENAKQARTRIGTAAALMLGAWCAPAIGSSGVDIDCPESKSALGRPLTEARPALTSHSESALQDILEDTTLATLPALAEASNQPVIDKVDDADSLEEPSTSRASTPGITTRLPGVPESSLPSFRRQMHRTDI
jgi:hypothetical protein